ncbi:MAG: hypothetical protein IJ398_03450 [Clostridia bacterium]|nr:hypothetical protein [Clostridia bacterium]
MLKKIFEKLKKPSSLIVALTFVLTMIFIALALWLVIAGYGGILEYISYVAYGLSAIFLGYTVYIICIYAPKFKGKLIKLLESNKLTNKIIKNFGFRALVFSAISFVFGIGYGALNLYLAIVSSSIWYFALAFYYVSLVLVRGGILLYQNKKRQGRDTRLDPLKKYRNSGIILVVLNLALSVAVIQMIFVEKFFNYPGLLIYAAAAYAFYKMTMAIIRMFKVKDEKDMTIKAVANVNLTDAVVSILALQTALLNTFGSGSQASRLANALTGTAVCLFVLALGIYMIAKAQKEIKKIKSEKIDIGIENGK